MSGLDDLRDAFLTSGLTDDQRLELIAAGEEVAFGPGDELFQEGIRADRLWILLTGEIELSRRLSNQPVVVATMDTPGQWAGGLTAWGDADAVYRATGRAAAPGRALVVPSDRLRDLVGRWSPFATHMIIGVFQTVRSIDARARERESLVALGELAARLAHEINNPAAASLRTVEALRETGGYVLEALVLLAEHSVTANEFLVLDGLRTDLQQRTAEPETALALSDREELIGMWMENHEIELAWRIAPVLAAAGVDRQWLDDLETAVGPAATEPALRWISSTVGMSALLTELAEATSRIGHLVEDVKTYTAMDRAEVQRVDVTSGIESTLAMMAPEMSGVEMIRSYGDVPDIDVYAAELNQVWTNLIDNAVDAMGGAGTLTIRTSSEAGRLVVEIVDSGPGVDPSAQNRVFEPFFTTKDVGEGTGLGLDISRRIVVDRHGGDIELVSVPGATTARVTLPIRSS